MRFALAILVTLAAAGVANASPYAWPTHDTDLGPGGFATVVVDYPKHGMQVPNRDMVIRLRTDNPNAALRVQLDGKDVDHNGRPHVARGLSTTDYPQWEFMDTTLAVPVKGLAPGLHTLAVGSGGIGTSLPRMNEQSITFEVNQAAAAADTVHWPTYATGPGPGGFATVSIQPRHVPSNSPSPW